MDILEYKIKVVVYMKCYNTNGRGYIVVLKTPNELINLLNKLWHTYTIGKHHVFPKENNYVIFINSHSLNLADRVADIWIESILGKFEVLDTYNECKLKDVGKYW